MHDKDPRYPCWLGDGGNHGARNLGGLQELRAPLPWQPARKLGPQSYNHKERNSASKWSESWSKLFPRAPRQESSTQADFSLSCKCGWAHLYFWSTKVLTMHGMGVRGLRCYHCSNWWCCNRNPTETARAGAELADSTAEKMKSERARG